MSSTWKNFLGYLGYEKPAQYLDDAEYESEDYEQNLSLQSVRKLERKEAGQTMIRSVPSQPSGKVHVVEPKSFNDAQRVADKFKSDIPVIVNLQSVDTELSKRLVDFASGLTYGRNGSMQKVADKVFLLTPSNFDVSAEEKRALWQKGLFYNQF